MGAVCPFPRLLWRGGVACSGEVVGPDRRLQLRVLRCDQPDRPAVVFLAHVGLEVCGGKVGRVLFVEDPVAAKAVGDAAEDGVQLEGFAVAQPAGVVVPEGVEPGVQPGLDAPVVDVLFEPLFGRQFAPGPACQQADRLGLTPGAFAPDAGGLRGQGMADVLAVDFGADEGAHERFFLFEALLARPFAGFQVKKGVAGSSTFFSIRPRNCGWLSLTV